MEENPTFLSSLVDPDTISEHVHLGLCYAKLQITLEDNLRVGKGQSKVHVGRYEV